MKKHFCMLLALACAVLLCSVSASASLPGSHEEYLKNESYKSAFDQFTLGMEEAKDRLTPAEYETLEKEGEEVIASSVKEDMERGYSEADAYETAYWARYEQVNRELSWDWLRKNAKDAQGFYRLKSDIFSGYMTLETGDGEEEDVYAVEIYVIMKKEPRKSADFKGVGMFEDGKMTVSDFYDDIAAITFDGETATVAASKALMDSDWFNADVTIDGEYVREKK